MGYLMGWLPHRKTDTSYEDMKGFANSFAELSIQLTNQMTNSMMSPQFKKSELEYLDEKPEEVDYSDLAGGSIGEPVRDQES